MPTEASAVAERVAAQIREVAKKAKNEEELRIGIEKCLTPALRTLGIEAEARYEKTGLRGNEWVKRGG